VRNRYTLLVNAALAFMLTFGKFRGRTLGNVAAVEPGYVAWLARSVHNRPEVLRHARVVLAHLALGHNVFKGSTAEESRDRIMKMPVPDFRKLDKRIEQKLNAILQRALARDPKQRFATADELLYDLEFYIYNSGYGPTNETLGKFVRDLFGMDTAMTAADARGSTRLIEHTARLTKTVPHSTQTTRSTRATKKTIRIA